LPALSAFAIASGAPPAAPAQQVFANLHTPAAMAATIHQLKGCLARIPASDRFLLSLRFGVGGRPQKTDAAVAARLNTTPATVRSREVVAVRRLTNARRSGACNHGPVKASAASSAPALALSPVGSHRSSGGGGISTDELLAAAVILTALIIIGFEFRKALFAPPPRH
jgi:hypothetical protein